MKLDLRSRLFQWLLAGLVILAALVWAECSAWRQINDLRAQIRALQSTPTQPAGQPSATAFVVNAEQSLTRLQRFLVISLLSVSAAVVGIMALLYRRTIAPLRNDLNQSLAVIERHEKLASLGVFAAGIAHEIRNPITAIKVRLFTLKNSHQPGSSEYEDLEVIRSEIDRLELIVSEFLQFARPAEPELRPASTERLMREVQQLLESNLRRRGVAIRIAHLDEAPILADTNKMKQVLINLVQNAAESIVGSGHVTLAARRDSRALKGGTRRVAVLEVSDSGSGIAPEIQKRLFDPFFTTKEQGTGLGLAIAARIVEKHGGVIEYKTELNRGTTFSVVLPLAEEHETKP